MKKAVLSLMSKKFRRGDKVVAIAGKDKGKSGDIVRVVTKKAKVVVAGINIAKRHVKPNKNMPSGGIVAKEMPLSVSNVAHLDPKLGLPTRVGYRVLEDGTKVRYAKKSGELIENQGK